MIGPYRVSSIVHIKAMMTNKWQQQVCCMASAFFKWLTQWNANTLATQRVCTGRASSHSHTHHTNSKTVRLLSLWWTCNLINFQFIINTHVIYELFYWIKICGKPMIVQWARLLIGYEMKQIGSGIKNIFKQTIRARQINVKCITLFYHFYHFYHLYPLLAPFFWDHSDRRKITEDANLRTGRLFTIR